MTKACDSLEEQWLAETGEEWLEDEIEKYLKPANLDLWSAERTRKVWHPEGRFRSVFVNEFPPIVTALQPIKDEKTGKIINWKEQIKVGIGKTNDLTMKRPPLPPHLATRGNPSRLPFLPTCFIEEKLKTPTVDRINLNESFMGEHLLRREHVFNRGVDFNEDGCTPTKTELQSTMGVPEEKVHKATSESEDKANVVEEVENVASDIDKKQDETDTITEEQKDHLQDLWVDENEANPKLDIIDPMERMKLQTDEKEEEESSVIEPLNNLPILNISKHVQTTKSYGSDWVEILDTSKPVEDFEKRVPNMAYKYPFELDTFQKLAIIKLEEQGHVFVAAHTSAGKTVVAEYAIALSLKHCTRIIYTSPVKALSNQKYREFVTAFGDVGLLTGDIQINTTASCLVMTTEILRSMLYYGADVIRDLEYVIFDEVHYINDTQRGYVWEEVLILLPAHCGIVMLSATVPNTLEFADWVGRTKKRKVYVVSTTKRPVALCHHLYTGTGGKSKDDIFMVLGPNGDFLRGAYNAASKSMLLRKMKKGPVNKYAQEKTMWIGLVDHLRRNDKLPVVVFILSRKRCDTTAENLRSLDLTTAKEKSRIHVFFQSCLKKLNNSDKKLPQVTTLQSLLASGVGIHHSGILPILKEVVEMLFQLGLVKILFATETFAVGVNMPARTVVFDSVTKYDGLNWRLLQTSEYIQMAGRAGRRGLDDTGTVIILCKKDIPMSSDLINMMLGKPSKLESQFRVTYATMLGLLRVTNLSIESMIKCSFREFDTQTKNSSHKVEMDKIFKKLSITPKTPNYDYLGRFCDVALQYYEESCDIMPILLAQRNLHSSPGSIVVVNFEKYVSHFGIVLEYSGTRSADFKILVLEFDEEYYKTPPDILNTNMWHSIIQYTGHCARFAKNYKFPNHTIITVKSKNIARVLKDRFKGECKCVLNDYEVRSHMKSNLMPNNACTVAVHTLVNITYMYYNETGKIDFADLVKGLKINNGAILDSIKSFLDLEKQLHSFGYICLHHNFYNEFPLVFRRKELEWKYEELVRLLSTEEMSLYPDYQRRLEVLKELRYIDSQHHVVIKGRVACELGKNELMITEIVFRNVLTGLDATEIAALLSCLVVEARIELKTPQKLDPRLENRIVEIQYIDEDLSELEKKYLVGAEDPTAQNNRLNFGLVEVVYEWAKGKSFCEVIAITDVQEGIIVHSIQKLHEVLMNVRDVAKIIGDPVLQAKMDEASLAIKRDIVFAASLYTQDDINSNFINFSKSSNSE